MNNSSYLLVLILFCTFGFIIGESIVESHLLFADLASDLYKRNPLLIKGVGIFGTFIIAGVIGKFLRRAPYLHTKKMRENFFYYFSKYKLSPKILLVSQTVFLMLGMSTGFYVSDKEMMSLEFIIGMPVSLLFLLIGYYSAISAVRIGDEQQYGRNL